MKIQGDTPISFSYNLPWIDSQGWATNYSKNWIVKTKIGTQKGSQSAYKFEEKLELKKAYTMPYSQLKRKF